MFLFENWYVAAFSHDLAVQQPMARRICNRPVVLFRTASGRCAALEDRCSHRAMPLSVNGRCFGETIRCGYHGFEFDADGTCVRIPSQAQIPERAGIRRYPLVERDGLLWIWMGRAEAADEGKIPAHPHHVDPRFKWGSFTAEFQAGWQLILDNLCDMTHISFVHEAIKGDTESHLNADIRIQPCGRDGVKIIRSLPNCSVPPYYAQFNRLADKIDRWTDYVVTPNAVRFWTGAADAGTGAFDGRREHGINMHSFHGVTPITETSSYYFFSIGGDFWQNDETVTDKLLEGAQAAIVGEDRPVIEAQQRRILDDPARPFIDVRTDAAGVQFRRILERLAAEERRVELAATANAG